MIISASEERREAERRMCVVCTTVYDKSHSLCVSSVHYIDMVKDLFRMWQSRRDGGVCVKRVKEQPGPEKIEILCENSYYILDLVAHCLATPNIWRNDDDRCVSLAKPTRAFSAFSTAESFNSSAHKNL